MGKLTLSSWERGRSRFGGEAAASGPPPGSLSTAVLALSPLGYWKLNETSGTTASDSSGNARHGTYAGPGAYTLANVAGPAGTGNYPSFAGGGGQVTIADNDVWSAGTASGITCFALIKPTSVSVYRPILTKMAASQYEWEVGHGAGTGEFDFFLYRGLSSGAYRWTWSGNILTTGWQVVAVSIDSAAGSVQAKMYRNGSTDLAASSTSAGSGSSSNGTAGVSIGYGASNPASAFLGAIGHVAIFAGALSGANIAALMAAAQTEGWF